MEGITFCLHLQKDVFIKFWTKWVKYVKPLRLDFVEVSDCPEMMLNSNIFHSLSNTPL